MNRPRPAWLVEVQDAVEPFEAEWRNLVVPGNSTPFQHYDLMRVFYRQLAANRTAEPVVALARHPDGRPAALFPMMRSWRHGLNWLHTDSRPIDYCAPIFETGLRQDDIRAIIKAVLAAVPRADLLYTNKMPQRFDGVENPLIALPNAARLRLSSWELPLAGRTREELVGAQQSRFRSKLRSRIQRLAKASQRSFDVAFGGQIQPSELAAFKALRTESLLEKHRSDILDDPNWGPFYDLLIEQGASAEAWLATLKADGRMIAGLYGFTDGRRVQAILAASRMDGEWKDYVCGLQLFQETMFYFQGRNIALYDLSIGDMSYKSRFGCEQVYLYDAVFPKTIIGHLYYLFWKLKIGIRSRMKPISSYS